MTTSTRDNPTENRYEIHDGDRLAGFSVYRINGRRIAFTHTETFADFAGRGLARQLVTGALEDVRRRGLDVLPFCPYVRKVIARHPELYLSLVPERERDRFGLPHDRTV
ncbi:GNAT family N-acetyltransferase [Streptomyces zhihengii]|uniref:GNAT family N-acetyltransferase n=1 Tax=Streptomyces zhihengii TaxID=1818004 RepID=UPI0033A16168